jgi:hypothetical protein
LQKFVKLCMKIFSWLCEGVCRNGPKGAHSQTVCEEVSSC